MTPRETVLAAIRHEPTDVIPYILSIDPEIWAKLDAHYGGRDRFPPHETFIASRGVDWQGPNAHDGMPPGHSRDIFGVEWVQGNIFHIVEPVLKDPSLEGYEFPELIADDEAADIAQWCDDNSARFRVFQFGLVFFERAWALRGMENILMDMVEHPEFVHDLLDQLMGLHFEALDKILHLPFESVRFGDDYGAQRGTLMGLPHWRAYLKPRLAKMYARVRDAGKIVSIHSCGDNSEILGEMIDMGLEVFNPAQPEAQDLAALKRQYGRHITFEGGIGTQRNLPFGTPQQVRDEIRRVRETLGPGGGFILTTTKSLRPEVPVENAVAAVEAILEEAAKGTPSS